MGRTIRWTLMAACSATVAGCTVVGTWSLASVDPEAARRDFEYKSLTLQKDGTFFADAEEGTAKTQSTTGVYTYEDGVLDLCEEDGERHTYDAKLCRAGKELELMQFWNGQKIKAEFVRKE